MHCFFLSPGVFGDFPKILADEREKPRHSWISASISLMAVFPAVLERAFYAGDGNTEGAICWVCIWRCGLECCEKGLRKYSCFRADLYPAVLCPDVLCPTRPGYCFLLNSPGPPLSPAPHFCAPRGRGEEHSPFALCDESGCVGRSSCCV